jgi:hypothetical protein
MPKTQLIDFIYNLFIHNTTHREPVAASIVELEGETAG